MRGATAVITMVLMFLVVIGATGMFFSYFRGLESRVVSEGEKQMIELDIPPKLLSLVCYTGYGYMDLSLSQGQSTVSGQVLYSVDLDTGKRVAEGFTDMEITDSGKVYIPYLFDKDKRYLVTLSGKNWKISEYCRPFDDPYMIMDLKFDDGSGTTASDSSEYETDGTLTNGPSWTNGLLNGGLEFDGQDDYVEALPELPGLTSFTVMGWWYPKEDYSQGSYSGGLINSITPDNYEFHLGQENSKVCFIVRGNDAALNFACSSSGAFSNQQDFWYFLTGVLDYDNVSFYVNGILNASISDSSVPKTLTTTNVGIGHANLKYFNGIIDEVRIYSRALSPQEISLIYQAYEGQR